MNRRTETIGDSAQRNSRIGDREGLEAAIALFQTGRIDEALTSLAALVAENPGDGPAWHALGLVRRQLGDTEAAIQALRRASGLMPFVPDCYADLAAVLEESAPKMAAECRRSHEAAKNAIDPHGLELLALASGGRFNDVLEGLDGVISRSPNDIVAHFAAALAYQSFNAIDEVIGHLRPVAESMPAFAGAHKAMGDYLSMKRRLRRMSASLRNAVVPDAASDDDDTALLEGAQESYRQALRHDPENAETLCYLGNVCLEGGRPADALEAYEAAILQEPDRGLALLNLALALETSSEHGKALEFARRAAAEEPTLAQAHECLARLSASAGFIDDALEAANASTAHFKYFSTEPYL